MDPQDPQFENIFEKKKVIEKLLFEVDNNIYFYFIFNCLKIKLFFGFVKNNSLIVKKYAKNIFLERNVECVNDNENKVSYSKCDFRDFRIYF